MSEPESVGNETTEQTPVSVSEAHVPLELADGTRAIAVPVSEWDELHASMETMTQERDEARQNLAEIERTQRTAEADTMTDDAVRQGRWPAAARKHLHDMAMRDPDGTRSMLADMPSRAPVREVGTAAGATGATMTSADRRHLEAAGVTEDDLRDLERDRAGSGD